MCYVSAAGTWRSLSKSVEHVYLWPAHLLSRVTVKQGYEEADVFLYTTTLFLGNEGKATGALCL